MLTPASLLRLIASRRLPQPTPDQGPANEVFGRAGRYGEMLQSPFGYNDGLLADEGSLYMASLGPGATALQLGISASFSATAAAVVLQNNESAAFDGGKRIYPKALRMLVSGAPTTATSWLYATVIDPANRAPTTVVNLVGGTPATATAGKAAPVALSLDQGAPPVGLAYFPLSTAAGAAPTVSGSTQATRSLVGNGSLRAQIPVVGDEYVIQFGVADTPGGALVTAAPAGASRVVSAHPAVVINPGGTLLIYMWGPSNATAGIVFSGMDLIWAER